MNIHLVHLFIFHFISYFMLGLNIHVSHGSFMISGSWYRNLIDNGSYGFNFLSANDDIR